MAEQSTPKRVVRTTIEQPAQQPQKSSAPKPTIAATPQPSASATQSSAPTSSVSKPATSAPKPAISTPKPATSAPKVKIQTAPGVGATEASPSKAQTKPSTSQASTSAPKTKPRTAIEPAPAVEPAAKVAPAPRVATTATAEPTPKVAPTPSVEPRNEPRREEYAQQASPVDEAEPQADATVTSQPQTKRSAGSVWQAIGSWVSRTFPGHEHAFWGGIVALLVALLVFMIGVWRVLFIGMVVIVGVAVGQIFDGDPKMVNAIRRLIAGDRDEDKW